jgi:hypothetical protein
MSFPAWWQHVFQDVVCVLSAVQRGTESHAARHTVHTPHPEIHVAKTLENS